MRVLGLLITASILLVPSAALAERSTGKVAKFDSNPRAITLMSGETILIPEGLSVHRLTAGDRVIVTWQYDGMEQVATRVNKQVLSNDD